MPRHVAFLRGVMPTNCRMADLKGAFEAAGFTAVRTVLSSGNVAFDTRSTSVAAIERRAEAAMKALPTVFSAMVRSSAFLLELLEADPFAGLALPAGSKKVVSFLLRPPDEVTLPVSLGTARIHRVRGAEAFTTYVPGGKAPDFMRLIESTFGREVTTRTWETVRRCAGA